MLSKFLPKYASAYKEVFETEAGKIVLSHMMRRYNFYSPTVSADGAHRTYFNEGQRNVVLDILGMLSYTEQELRDIVRAISEEENESEF